MDTKKFKRRLLAQREALLTVLDSGNQAARPVALDQTRVGRLSRMDAMSQQAIAQATAGRRQAQLRQIAEALTRLEQGHFGYCADCEGPIGAARLDANPTVSCCIVCAERAESG